MCGWLRLPSTWQENFETLCMQMQVCRHCISFLLLRDEFVSYVHDLHQAGHLASSSQAHYNSDAHRHSITSLSCKYTKVCGHRQDFFLGVSKIYLQTNVWNIRNIFNGFCCVAVIVKVILNCHWDAFFVLIPTLISAHSEVTLETVNIFVYTHIL
jgi:hypothetical protein